MSDLPIVTAYDRLILPNLVYIVVEINDGRLPIAGTGTIFGRINNASARTGAFILTAKHLIEVPIGATATYRIVRFPNGSRPGRQASFTYANSGMVAGPRAFWWVGVHPQDFGAIIAPEFDDSGQPFLDPNEFPKGGIGESNIALSAKVFLAGAGTRVAWAGYSAVAADIFGEPVPCYYEGVVAYVHNQVNSPIYLLDGHNTFGVSGGPAWWWNEVTNRVELFAIITQYHPTSPSSKKSISLPGFTIATPVNHFMSLLDSIIASQMNNIATHPNPESGKRA